MSCNSAEMIDMHSDGLLVWPFTNMLWFLLDWKTESQDFSFIQHHKIFPILAWSFIKKVQHFPIIFGPVTMKFTNPQIRFQNSHHYNQPLHNSLIIMQEVCGVQHVASQIITMSAEDNFKVCLILDVLFVTFLLLSASGRITKEHTGYNRFWKFEFKFSQGRCKS